MKVTNVCYLIILYIVINYSNLYVHSWEYCKREKEICHEFGPHTQCFNNSKDSIEKPIGISEIFVSLMPTTRKIQRLFLSAHNKYRNLIASGNDFTIKTGKFYPKAARMRELEWIVELQYSCEFHAKLVRHGHDYCHNTDLYRYTGQNLHYASLDCYTDNLELVNKSVFNFYIEKDLISDPDFEIKKVTKTTSGIGHFLVLVHERAAAVGCAVSLGFKCRNQGLVLPYAYYVVCNYDVISFMDFSVYKPTTGKPGSECSYFDDSGISKEYENLCENNHKYYLPFTIPNF